MNSLNSDIPAVIASFGPLIIYDGECIFCDNYVKMHKMRLAIGQVSLVDARSNHPAVEACWQLGYDLNAGMIFSFENKIYFGADAINQIALLTEKLGFWQKIINAFFRSKFIAKLCYPLMRAGRGLVLLVRFKPRLKP